MGDFQAKVIEAYPHLKLDPTRINRAFEEFGKTHNIPVLDALSVLLEGSGVRETGLYYNIEDEHMTAKSHRLVAMSLAKQLYELGLVERR